MAKTPSVDLNTIRHLAEDRIDMVANAAGKHLGLKPRFVLPRIPRIGLATGRVIR
ncbi:hypothetical protein [Sinomonas gamaensis]|uniref:hypothetical protein n=1 Tax=Sinomonas gamaensis TaxID=2565624 RepID=UPI0014871736|nr:hypothetical protein [Sinomonas gamaensis]